MKGPKKGRAAAVGGLALIAGGLAALRKRQGGQEASAPGPVTATEAHPATPAATAQPVAHAEPRTT